MAEYTKEGKRIIDLDGARQGRLFSAPGRGAAGKGDKPCDMNKAVYDRNFDNLDWNNNKE
jgi:hypothetical protein